MSDWRGSPVADRNDFSQDTNWGEWERAQHESAEIGMCIVIVYMYNSTDLDLWTEI